MSIRSRRQHPEDRARYEQAKRRLGISPIRCFLSIFMLRNGRSLRSAHLRLSSPSQPVICRSIPSFGWSMIIWSRARWRCCLGRQEKANPSSPSIWPVAWPRVSKYWSPLVVFEDAAIPCCVHEWCAMAIKKGVWHRKIKNFSSKMCFLHFHRCRFRMYFPSFSKRSAMGPVIALTWVCPSIQARFRSGEIMK